MAEKLKKDNGISKADLAKLVEKIEGQKAKASEYNGTAGQLTSDAVENKGVNKKALSFVIQLRKKEDNDRQAILRGVIDYAHKLGMFDSVDAFDDLVARLEEIAAEVRARGHNGKDVDNVVGMTTGSKAAE